MPWCTVPNCPTNKNKKNTDHISTFKVPSDEDEREQWRLNLGIPILRSSHRICEKHFDENFIIKEWIQYDNDKKIIVQVQHLLFIYN